MWALLNKCRNTVEPDWLKTGKRSKNRTDEMTLPKLFLIQTSGIYLLNSYWLIHILKSCGIFSIPIYHTTPKFYFIFFINEYWNFVFSLSRIEFSLFIISCFTLSTSPLPFNYSFLNHILANLKNIILFIMMAGV